MSSNLSLVRPMTQKLSLQSVSKFPSGGTGPSSSPMNFLIAYRTD
jgi:hypothetical protein